MFDVKVAPEHIETTVEHFYTQNELSQANLTNTGLVRVVKMCFMRQNSHPKIIRGERERERERERVNVGLKLSSKTSSKGYET